MSSVDPAREPPGGLIPVIGTDYMASMDPVITQLLADGPVGDDRISWIWTLRSIIVRVLRT